GGCGDEEYEAARGGVEGAAGTETFEDCELGDGSTVPSDFPKGSLAPVGVPEHTLGCGLSSQLDALGEPSLFPSPRAAEVYRVLWLRSGGHPVSVRFERQGEAGPPPRPPTRGEGPRA